MLLKVQNNEELKQIHNILAPYN